MANAVEIVISVRDEDAVRKLRDLKGNVEGLGHGGNVGAGGTEARRGFGEATSGAHDFGEALHALRPVLHTAGIEISGFREWGALASTGIGAFAAALSGSLLVALANIGAEADKTKKRLEGVYGTAAPKATEQATAGAKDLGRSTSEFADQMERLQHVQYLRGPNIPSGGFTFPEHKEGSTEPWAPPPGSAVAKIFSQDLNRPEAQRSFLENFDKLLRGTGASPEASKKAVDSLLEEWQKQAEAGKPPTLTEDAVKSIYTASPEAARRLSGALGAISPVMGAPSAEQLQLMTRAGYIWHPEQVAGAVSELSQQSQHDFENRIRSVPESAGALKNTIQRSVEPAGEGVGRTLGDYLEMLSRGQIPGVVPGGHGDETTKNILSGAPTYEPRDTTVEGAAVQRARAAITPTQPVPVPADWVHAMVDRQQQTAGGTQSLSTAGETFWAAVRQFAAAVATLTQKSPAQPSTAPSPALPNYFPQGKGSGRIETPSVPAQQSAPASPPPVPKDKGGSSYHYTPSGIIIDQNTAAPPSTAPAQPPSRQTAVVTRDKDGNPVVIQPDEEGHAEGGLIGLPQLSPALLHFAYGGLVPHLVGGGVPDDDVIQPGDDGHADGGLIVRGYADGGAVGEGAWQDADERAAAEVAAERRAEAMRKRAAEKQRANISALDKFRGKHHERLGPIGMALNLQKLQNSFGPAATGMAAGGQLRINPAIFSGLRFAFGGEALRWFDGGGSVAGPGGPTEDKIPAMLSNGEYVLPERSVRFYGLRLLESLRSTSIPKFDFRNAGAAMKGLADGGFASDGGGSSSSGATSPTQFPSTGDDSPANRELGSVLHLHLSKDTSVPVATDRDSLKRIERAAVMDKLLNIVRSSDAVR